MTTRADLYVSAFRDDEGSRHVGLLRVLASDCQIENRLTECVRRAGLFTDDGGVATLDREYPHLGIWLHFHLDLAGCEDEHATSVDAYIVSMSHCTALFLGHWIRLQHNDILYTDMQIAAYEMDLARLASTGSHLLGNANK